MLQTIELHKDFDELQLTYGAPSLSSIYGAGNISSPNIMFIFMNPTGRNISASFDWNGLRAPWIGTKQVWKIFNELDLLSNSIYSEILLLKPKDWSVSFVEKLYKDIQEHNIYITNLAKCTQLDARPLKDNVFQKYLPYIFKEIEIVKPKKIVAFGNQVSTVLIGKNISVGNYTTEEKEIVNGYDIYPTYYPVGQGRRNMPLAIERIKRIM